MVTKLGEQGEGHPEFASDGEPTTNGLHPEVEEFMEPIGKEATEGEKEIREDLVVAMETCPQLSNGTDDSFEGLYWLLKTVII